MNNLASLSLGEYKTQVMGYLPVLVSEEVVAQQKANLLHSQEGTGNNNQGLRICSRNKLRLNKCDG
jgi:hypothetical protein